VKLLFLRNVVNEVQNFFQKLFTDREKSMQEWLDHDVSRYVQTRDNLVDYNSDDDDDDYMEENDNLEQNDVDMDMDIDMGDDDMDMDM